MSKTITKEKKITSPISDDNGYEIFVTYTLLEVIEGWERDEDDLFTPLEFHYEIEAIHDVVLQHHTHFISIADAVLKNSLMHDIICNTLLETAEDNWNK
jgi:hypothetical protein